MRISSFLALVPLLAACSSESPGGMGGAGSGGGAGGGGGAETLAPPEVGMQLATTKVTIDPAAEKYLCWSFQVPAGADLSLVGLENQIPTVGVHHYAVFTNLEPYKEPGPYDCETMGITWGLVAGGGVGTPGVEFPQGTAMNLPAGQHVIFQLHMLNASSDPLEVQPAYINLVGTKDTSLQPVGLLIAGTLDIAVPAHSTDVAVSGGCAVQDPMANIFAVFPHMHQLGRRLVADVTPAGASAPTTVADQAWNFQDQGLYPVKASAAAGDQINVTCHYDNPGDKDVNFGLSSNDEMCVNVFYYYPATKPSAFCGIGD